MQNARCAVTGIARHVISQKPSGARVIVGRDPRFLGETLVPMASEILSAHGITPLVNAEPAPTPSVVAMSSLVPLPGSAPAVRAM